MKKGAIFDQDGLMFDTEKLYTLAWIEASERFGVKMPDGFRKAVAGSSGEGMAKITKQFYPTLDIEPFIAEMFKICHEMQLTMLEEKKGLHELLEYLHEQGVKMVVASSSKRANIVHNLERSGIEQYFEGIICGDDVGKGKPDPEIFLKAAAALHLDPQDCYVLEDSFNGVRAGHAAGCCTIMVPDMLEPDEEMTSLYDVCCSDLIEVMDKIRAGEI